MTPSPETVAFRDYLRENLRIEVIVDPSPWNGSKRVTVRAHLEGELLCEDHDDIEACR